MLTARNTSSQSVAKPCCQSVSNKQVTAARKPVPLPCIVSNRCYFICEIAFVCVGLMEVQTLSYRPQTTHCVTAACSAPPYIYWKGFPGLFTLILPDLHLKKDIHRTHASLCLQNRGLENCQFSPSRRHTAILHIRLSFVNLFLCGSG